MQVSKWHLSRARKTITAAYREALQADPTAAEGEWYPREAQAVRRASGWHPSALAVAAILSPAVRWEDLVRRLPAFFDAWRLHPAGDAPTFPGYRANVRKAWNYLRGLASLEPTAPKTYRFWRNLAGDVDVATIDRWAVRIALRGGTPEGPNGATPISHAEYLALEEAYAGAAADLGTTIPQVQAITWARARELAS